MPVQSKDYYAILGLNRTATTVEVKKAFRKLARVHHPDVAKNKAAGEMMFKEIHEAYETLCDPLKRRQYNEADGNWSYGIPATTPPGPRPASNVAANPPPRSNSSTHVNFEEAEPRAQARAANPAYRDDSGRYSQPPRDPSESFARPSAFDTDPKNKMPARWFIRNKTGDKEGPFDFVELAALLRCGDITAATATRMDGESSWMDFADRHEFSWARDMPAEIIYRHLNTKAMSFADAKPFTFRKIYYFFGLLIGICGYVLYFFLLGGGKFFLGGALNFLIFKIFFYLVGGHA